MSLSLIIPLMSSHPLTQGEKCGTMIILQGVNYRSMRIWFGYSRRMGKCEACNVFIEKEDIIIRTQPEYGVINKYHIKCFVGYLTYWQQEHPFAALKGGPGRRPLGLTIKQKAKRAELSREKYKLMNKKKYYLKYRMWELSNDIDVKLQAIEDQLNNQLTEHNV